MNTSTGEKIRNTFQPLADEEGYRWLDSRCPAYIARLELLALDQNVTPENLGSALVSTFGNNRGEFVRACQGALRHIRSTQ